MSAPRLPHPPVPTPPPRPHTVRWVVLPGLVKTGSVLRFRCVSSMDSQFNMCFPFDSSHIIDITRAQLVNHRVWKSSSSPPLKGSQALFLECDHRHCVQMKVSLISVGSTSASYPPPTTPHVCFSVYMVDSLDFSCGAAPPGLPLEHVHCHVSAKCLCNGCGHDCWTRR